MRLEDSVCSAGSAELQGVVVAKKGDQHWRTEAKVTRERQGGNSPQRKVERLLIEEEARGLLGGSSRVEEKGVETG